VLIIQVSNNYSVITGGQSNTNSSSSSFIGGGEYNIVSLTYASAIISGYGNTVSGSESVIAGGSNNQITSFNGFIGGGEDHWVVQKYGAIAGGQNNYVQSAHGFVGGGYRNIIYLSSYGSVIAGGGYYASPSDYADGNYISGKLSFIGGGSGNRVESDYSAVLSGNSNTVSGQISSITSGQENQITSSNSNISSGSQNTISTNYSFIGTGLRNTISNIGWSAICSGYYCTVTGESSFIGAGDFNAIVGDYSTIPGGKYLKIGDRSFGFRGGVNDEPETETDLSSLDGTFHIVDTKFYFNYNNDSDADFRVDGSNNYLIFADAGDDMVGIGRLPTTNALEVNGNASKSSAGTWLSNSDRRIKTEITDINDSYDLMLKLRPVKFKYTNWYLSQHPKISDRFYYNFIAQEYAEVFPESVKGSGEYLESGEEILQMDSYNAQIVTIKAVQELIKENEVLKQDNQHLQQEVNELKKQYQMLFKMVSSMKEKPDEPIIKTADGK
jgi:hypothetical protein